MGMMHYFKTVTLGAFTWKNEERIALLMEHIRKTGTIWLLLHFFLITCCLNFPVILSMARLAPFEFYSRLYGENFSYALPESARAALTESVISEQAAIENFNMLMLESGYSRDVLLPFLSMAFGLIIIIQVVFYLCSVFFLKLSRMNLTPLSFHDRIGLALFSSTLPVPAAAIFGLYLPTVHIIIFYFLVMFFIFQRSKCYR
ncbi:MAG: hypothetical protein FWG89_05285 [Treponema sp.]|nr:hypothetical protein [Treponema sp.]